MDSLDAAELFMTMEEEFSIIIPDNDAVRINTIAEAVEYISMRLDAR
jgi:acyl carrier protein